MNELTPTTPSPIAATEETLLWFGHDPLWLVILKVVGIFVILVLVVLFTIWLERRVVGRMQQRIGPNRTGPFGLLQSLMDGFKLAFKEEIFPTAADKAVYIIAPILSVVPAYMAWAVIPFGPEVSIFGQATPLQLTDFPVAVLYILAIASIGIYGIVLAGWASGSTYPLLGGLRSSAQMISYEIAMGLSFVAVFLFAGTMSTSSIVNGQVDLWFGLLVLPSFLIYATAMIGETNRAPFDLPEAESELVGGFHTEYSTMKFALFFLAEYINMVTVSAVAVTLFLGGWRAPFPISMWSGANEGWFPMIWFFLKIFIFIFVFIWLRGTLPRFRYDQFMRFGWKVLIPISVLWILIIAIIRGVSDEYGLTATPLAITAGFIVTVAVLWILGRNVKRRRVKNLAENTIPEKFKPNSGGFPVPPLPGQEYRPARRTVVADVGAATDAGTTSVSEEVRGG
ncbi:MAG: NADH-quinone oxidoreductase subunit NuoH [Candidatus Nanopelagicales bacterium]